MSWLGDIISGRKAYQREVEKLEAAQRAEVASAELRTSELQTMIEGDAAPAYLSSADMQIIMSALAEFIRNMDRRIITMREAHEINPINPKVMAKAQTLRGKAQTLYIRIKDESEARHGAV